METHEGKSIPVVKQFQIVGSWAPVTPVKPTLTRPRLVYEDGQGGFLGQAFVEESEGYLSSFSQPNQPKSLLSCSISSAEKCIPHYYKNNHIWEANSRMNLQTEKVESQRRGLEDYLVRDGRTLPSFGSPNSGSSSLPWFSSWGLPLPFKNNGVREIGNLVERNGISSVAQFDNMSFKDILAMKGSSLEPSMVSTRQRDTDGTAKSFFHAWESQPEESTLDSNSTFKSQEYIQYLSQQHNGNFGQEMQSSVFHHEQQNFSNVKSTPNTKHVNGKNTVFAPVTPDLQSRAEKTRTSENINIRTHQRPNDQNGLQENEVASAVVNLQGLDNKEVTQPTTDSPGQLSVVIDEDYNPDEGGNRGFDLNKTPQKKTRRKRYLPKVVSEKKPKQTPKPKTPNPTDSKEPPKTKRKCVQKNATNTPSTTPEATKTIDPKPTEPAVKSCRRSLNFDLNGQMTQNNSLNNPNGALYADTQPDDCHTVHRREGEELMVETSQLGIAYDLNRTLNQELKNYIALPDQVDLGKRGSKRAHSSITETGNVRTANHCTFWQPNPIFLHNAEVRGFPRILFPEICKKRRTDRGQRLHTSSASCSIPASQYFSQTVGSHNHPRVDCNAPKYCSCNPATCGTNAMTNNQVGMLMGSAENRVQFLNTWLDMSRLKRKKRSKGTTRARDLSPLKGIGSVLPAKPAAKSPHRRKSNISNTTYLGVSSNFNQSTGLHSRMEMLAKERSTRLKMRNMKRNAVANSSSEAKKHWDLVLYNDNQSIRSRTGPLPVLQLVKANSIKAITEGLKLLDINREGSKFSYKEQRALVPYCVNNQEKNALVPYRNDGNLEPFEGPFDPNRKQRQRAKVNLDDETTRVWQLLLENIDNEGIDGTDEEKAKWWENERGVFHGRVDSFIARMRLVQGDRRFTPWKGSVLDSVVGVFLTQNVSDHLSSSAFMTMAARFPINSQNCGSTNSEEATSALGMESEIFVIEPEESIMWNYRPLDQPVSYWNSRTIHENDNTEEKEVVSSKELIRGVPGSVITVDISSESSQKAANMSRINKANSHVTEMEAASILGDDRARDNATLPQQSAISSQNSVNSPNLTLRVMNKFLESNVRTEPLASSSQCHYLDCSTSFMGLLKMAESPLLHDSYSQMLKQDRTEFSKHVAKDSPEAPGISSSNYQFHQKSNFHVQATTAIEIIEVGSRPSNASRDESSTVEQSNLTTESMVQTFIKEKDCNPRTFENVRSCYVLEGDKMIMQTQTQSRKDSGDNAASSVHVQASSNWKSANTPNSSPEAADVTESTTALNREKNYHTEVEQISGHNYTSAGISAIPNAYPSRPKKGRVGNEKRNAYDWDNLRKQVQVDGKKKERPAHRRDSLDWEAVRHADVSEIAETIKARGMNNMLAERIKDFLDRLVEEHGSIDLEWIRDIPPDKAKEYLLSFRGLGLKSVECIRLLTLHHLAFPVDTNVGRIAVRLGWVPLQPLPESLQLHLLELYPVLESIQKYLWPRLCKLDQKTLYELHYHMITFGKVFCTKRQPNCNACPLRGECRHFASAYTSARLALPGPEERSIVASSGGVSVHEGPPVNINPLTLPASWSNHHQETNFRSNKDAYAIEVPSTPLSLPLPQTIHHLKRTSQANCEPIVEVPASPEPESEQEQTLCDIEDAFCEDPNEIPTLKVNMKEFTWTIQNFVQANRELQEIGMSRALVALTPEAASIPVPKLKNISRLRTEHHVYELPDTHPLLRGLDKREPDDPCSYLLAIWTPGETANSIQPPERICTSQDPSIHCNEQTCSYCSSQWEINSQIVRGTLLIPCRTAMRGSFPLNGTYFQVNEVFADHESSLNPIEVPRSWLWNLPRRTVYFGTSIPTIFRGLTTEDIQHCFWRGYVCVRGFDQATRAPRPLLARLHFPASKLPRGRKGKADDE